MTETSPQPSAAGLAACTFRAGNLTKDPVIRSFPDGNSAAYLRIAYTDADGQTRYVSAEVRRRNLEWLERQNLRKGSFVIAIGHEHERYNDYRGEDETILRVSLMACRTSWDRTPEDAHTGSAPRPQTKHPDDNKPAKTSAFIGGDFTGSDYDTTGRLKPETPATETPDPNPYGDEWFDAAPEY